MTEERLRELEQSLQTALDAARITGQAEGRFGENSDSARRAVKIQYNCALDFWRVFGKSV